MFPSHSTKAVSSNPLICENCTRSSFPQSNKEVDCVSRLLDLQHCSDSKILSVYAASSVTQNHLTQLLSATTY